MAREPLRIEDKFGEVHEYRNTWLKKYEAKVAKDGVCVVEKPLIGRSSVVDCFSKPEPKAAEET